MKIKQHVHIVYPDKFLRGDYVDCFNLFDTPNAHPDWIDAGEIELDIEVDKDSVIARVVTALDEEIEKETAEHELKMELLKQRKNEMLALTHEVSE
jgi:hypothetical protein